MSVTTPTSRPTRTRSALRVLRPRFTYANVVASIALFVALGGTSLAAFHLTSSDIRDRSIRGIDVRRNSLTGSEIAESTLGPVPRAITADVSASSHRADTAVSASTAASAGRANSADTADLSANALQLGGLGSSRYATTDARSVTLVTTGRSEISSWPELGVKVETDVKGQASEGEVYVTSTRTSGNIIVRTGSSPSQEVLTAGTSTLPYDAPFFPIMIWSDAPGATGTLQVDCSYLSPVEHCVTTRSGTAG